VINVIINRSIYKIFIHRESKTREYHIVETLFYMGGIEDVSKSSSFITTDESHNC